MDSTQTGEAHCVAVPMSSLAELDGLLDSERLVTLIGPVGVGKTSVAIKAAEMRVTTLEEIADALDRGQALLVLDNLDQRLTLLVAGRCRSRDRHRTMQDHAMVSWEALVAKSLLVVDPAGTKRRYRLLASIPLRRLESPVGSTPRDRATSTGTSETMPQRICVRGS